MIWLPLAPPITRGRQAADVALYRAQLAELDRDRDSGRLEVAEHAAARLEVQRRLLAAPPDAPPPSGGRLGLVVALLAVPGLATGLYLAQGFPEVPSASLATRQQQEGDDDTLLFNLRLRMAHLDPTSDAAVKGWTLLGNAERLRGRIPAAIEAYRIALSGRFDAETAGQLAQTLLEVGDLPATQTLLADALPRAPDHIGLRFLAGLVAERAGRAADARAAWASLLRDAPPDAPWRVMVERRMQSLD